MSVTRSGAHDCDPGPPRVVILGGGYGGIYAAMGLKKAAKRHQIELSGLDALPRSWRKQGLRLLMILRLAVLLNRSRIVAELPELAITVTENSLSIRFDEDWLADNPLTIADLEREQGFLAQVGYSLGIEPAKKGPREGASSA